MLTCGGCFKVNSLERLTLAVSQAGEGFLFFFFFMFFIRQGLTVVLLAVLELTV